MGLFNNPSLNHRSVFKVIWARSCWFVASFLWRGWTMIMSNSNLWWVLSRLADTAFVSLAAMGSIPGLFYLHLPEVYYGPWRKAHSSTMSSWWAEETMREGSEMLAGSVNFMQRAESLIQFTSCLWRAKWTAHPSNVLLICMGEKDNECLLDEAINL